MYVIYIDDDRAGVMKSRLIGIVIVIVGVVASRAGEFLAGCGYFRATISHDGPPQAAMNTILAASATVISLQNLVSREANPLDGQVYNIHPFHRS